MKQEDRDLLIRIDERTHNIAKEIADMKRSFASKWIEKPVIGIMSIIVGVVVVALVNTVVKALSK